MAKKAKMQFSAWAILIAIVVICVAALWLKSLWYGNSTLKSGEAHGPEALIENYGTEISRYSKEFKLPAHFVAALCLLECSGRKPISGRFEKHVYTKLKLVKLGVRSNYEHVTIYDLKDATDDAINNLSTSWGPFQLMGYKCLLYNIKIRDLRGDDGVYWAIKWINESYGKMLRKGNYAQAFHYHNTGKLIPKSGKHLTHDKDYVKNGLKWMDYFEADFGRKL